MIATVRHSASYPSVQATSCAPLLSVPDALHAKCLTADHWIWLTMKLVTEPIHPNAPRRAPSLSPRDVENHGRCRLLAALPVAVTPSLRRIRTPGVLHPSPSLRPGLYPTCARTLSHPSLLPPVMKQTFAAWSSLSILHGHQHAKRSDASEEGRRFRQQAWWPGQPWTKE